MEVKISKRQALLDLINKIGRDIEVIKRECEQEKNSTKGDFGDEASKMERAFLSDHLSTKAHKMLEEIGALTSLKFNYNPDYIGSGCIVKFENCQVKLIFFILPLAGGHKFQSGDNEIMVISEASSFFDLVKGKSVGDEVNLRGRKFTIEEII